jgi:hypothetical protein
VDDQEPSCAVVKLDALVTPPCHCGRVDLEVERIVWVSPRGIWPSEKTGSPPFAVWELGWGTKALVLTPENQPLDSTSVAL